MFIICNSSDLNSLSLTHYRRRVWQVVIVVDVVLHLCWNLNEWVSSFKFNVEFFLREGWSFEFGLFSLFLAFFTIILGFGSCLSEFFVNFSFKVLYNTIQISKVSYILVEEPELTAFL